MTNGTLKLRCFIDFFLYHSVFIVTINNYSQGGLLLIIEKTYFDDIVFLPSLYLKSCILLLLLKDLIYYVG